MSESSMTIQFEGKEYRIEDFELGELEWLEDEMGVPLGEVDASSMKAAVRFVCLIKRREDPEFSIDDARKLKLAVFDDDTPANGNGNGAGAAAKKRPTKAAKRG